MAKRNGQGLKVAVMGNEFGSDRRAVPTSDASVEAKSGQGRSMTAELLQALEEEIRAAQRIVLSLPGDRMVAGLRGGQSCLAGLVVDEVNDDAPDFAAAPAQITRALNLIEMLVRLDGVDPFAVKIVLLRAMPKKAGWKRISEMDPHRRCRRQLFNLHREALGALLLAMRKNKFGV